MVLFAGFTACQKGDQQKEDSTVRLVYANWSEGVAMTNLASVILDEKMGYNVVTKMTDIEQVFELLNTSEYDVFVDAWLPETHGNYMQQYGSSLEDLSVVIEEVRTGLVVPAYMDVESISDLNGQVDVIKGIGSGAGVMQATHDALQSYELSLTLEDGSEEAMTEALDDAIKRRAPIVITGWIPHWLFNRYDLKFLEDPKNVYGASEKIHTIARSGFTSDHPQVSLFFERFKLTETQLETLMDEMESMSGNEKQAVKNWMDDHERLVNKWVRGLQPQRITVM